MNISEVGESSKRNNLLGNVDGVVGANGYTEVVNSAMEIAPILGLSFGGDEKRFMDMLSDIEEGQHREGVFAENEGSISKPKGWRERKPCLRWIATIWSWCRSMCPSIPA
jgi:hypothetical protein